MTPPARALLFVLRRACRVPPISCSAAPSLPPSPSGRCWPMAPLLPRRRRRRQARGHPRRSHRQRQWHRPCSAGPRGAGPSWRSAPRESVCSRPSSAAPTCGSAIASLSARARQRSCSAVCAPSVTSSTCARCARRTRTRRLPRPWSSARVHWLMSSARCALSSTPRARSARMRSSASARLRPRSRRSAQRRCDATSTPPHCCACAARACSRGRSSCSLSTGRRRPSSQCPGVMAACARARAVPTGRTRVRAPGG
mmetsp:Transcript_16350/g.42363  ORF Transcript_16350/g.42363 Transcript_16350/m.42363 type:complete len:255 (-) Transcript_16350:378-1142(-)